MINFFVLYATFGFLSYRCFALSFGLSRPGLLLLVCRSLRYYFAIHFCLTQFQFQFSFSSSCLHFIIIWIHSWQKRNEMKQNETLQCKLNADAGNFLLTFSSFLVSFFFLLLFRLTQKERNTKKELRIQQFFIVAVEPTNKCGLNMTSRCGPPARYHQIFLHTK